MGNTNLNGNLNISSRKRGGVPIIPDKFYWKGAYDGLNLVNEVGVNVPYVSGFGIDAVYDFSVLSGNEFDKGSYIGNSFGLPEIYDFPYVNIYYDPTSAATRKHWKLTDFHYRWIEAQFNPSGTLNNIFFARFTYVTEETITLTDCELLIYSNKQSALLKLRNYIGINDFQNQGNWYYTNEWIIRDMIQFIITGTTFSVVLNGVSQMVYWGDGTSDVVNSDSTYTNNYTYGGKHLVSVSKGMKAFIMFNKALTGDVEYWGDSLKDMSDLQLFYIYDNKFTGKVGAWDLSGLSALLQFRISGNLFTGAIDDLDFSNASGIQRIYLNDNQFTGSGSGWDFSGLTSLEQLRIQDNQLSEMANTESLSIVTYSVSNNNISQLGIDNILAGFEAYFKLNPPIKNGSFNLSSNSIPSASGLANKALIEGYYTAAGFTATITVDT